MPEIRVSIYLPYLLLLPNGDYPTPAVGGSIRIRDVGVASAGPNPGIFVTEVSTLFVEEGSREDIFARARLREADTLLRRTNHLLRWYRASSRQVQVTELTRAQASPFSFTVEDIGIVWGGNEPLYFEPAKLPARPSVDWIHQSLKEGLTSARDPDVASLNLLDAEGLLATGRFREAILLCWSAIDATFGSKYSTLVDSALAGEWSEARAFFSGFEIPLRTRMSAVLHLLAGRSLFREPGLWSDLSISYTKRNQIIHRGDTATEAEAEQGLRVAREILRIMSAL